MTKKKNNTYVYQLKADNYNMPTEGTISPEYDDSPEGKDISNLVDGDWTTSFYTPKYCCFYYLEGGKTPLRYVIIRLWQPEIKKGMHLLPGLFMVRIIMKNGQSWIIGFGRHLENQRKSCWH